MKKTAIVLVFTAMALFLGFSGAKAAEITVSGITRLSENMADHQKMMVGRWVSIREILLKEGVVEKRILVKVIAAFEPDGWARISITGYKFGLPLGQERFFGRYSIGEADNKLYLFLNKFNGGVWGTAEIISLEQERAKLKIISDSSGTSFVSYEVLWQKITTPAD